MNNLIEFPKSKIVRESMSAEGMEKIRKKGMKKYADAVAHDLSSLILMELGNYGIDTEGDDFLRDFVLLSGILSASIYRSMDMEHPLQKMIETTVQIKEFDPDSDERDPECNIPGVERIDINEEV